MQPYFAFTDEGKLVAVGTHDSFDSADDKAPDNTVWLFDLGTLAELGGTIAQIVDGQYPKLSLQLQEHLSRKLGGPVICSWDESEHKPFSCSGSELPAHPDLVHVYPHGWSYHQDYSLEEALAILKEKL